MNDSLEFLKNDPQPVGRQEVNSVDILPAATINQLMQIAGVNGVWIEKDGSGQRVVVLHYTAGGSISHLPTTVAGMRTVIVKGYVGIQ